MNVNMRNDRDVELQNASIRVINLGKAQVVVTPTPAMFHVLTSGLPEAGTIDLDATLIGLVGTVAWSCSGGTLSGISGPKAQLRYADMTGPVATVLATVTYAGQPIVGRAAISVVRDGATGATAKVVVLEASEDVFKINKAGANSPAAITLTASGQNLGGTPSFTIPVGSATLSPGVDGSQKILTFANMTSDSVTVAVTQDGVTDRVTIVKLREGLDGVSSVTGFLTNESVTVAATSAGVIGSLAAAGGTFRILDGTTDMTGNAAVAYSVLSETGCDLSIAASGAYTVASLSADTGTAVLRAVYKGVTIDQAYTIVKARAGADGTAPIYVDVFTSGGQMFSRATAADSFAPASLTLSSTVYGGSASAYQWQYWTGSDWTAIAGATASSYAVPSGSFTGSRVFRLAATVGGTTYFDEVTLVQVTGGSNGADAITGVLTNELVALPASNAGAVSSYTGAVCTLNIYKGITLDTGWAFAFSPVPDAQTLAYTTNGSTVTITGMAAGVDAAFVDITATKNGFGSVVKRFSVTKSKAGLQGQTGTGSPGTRGTVDIQATIAGSTWSDASADGALSAAGYGSPIKFDLVTLRNVAAGYIQTKVWDGDSWEDPGLILNGNLTAPGTILTAALAAGAVTADKFDGRSIDLKDAAGNITFRSGLPLSDQTRINRNLIPAVFGWPLNDTTFTNGATRGFALNDTRFINGEYLHLPTSAGGVFANSPPMGIINGGVVTVTFDAYTLSGTRQVYGDVYGPNVDSAGLGGGAGALVTTTRAKFKFTDTINHADAPKAWLRLFCVAAGGDVIIGNIKVEYGTVDTAWCDSVVTPFNSAQYVMPDSITNTQFGGDLVGTLWNGIVGPGGAGWLLQRNGKFYCNDISVRGAVMGGSYTSFNSPAAGAGTGFYLGSEGLALGNYNDGRYAIFYQNGDIVAPGLSLINKQLTLTNPIIVTPTINNPVITTPFSAVVSEIRSTGNPTNQTAFASTSATISGGSGDYTYAWSFNGRDGSWLTLYGDPSLSYATIASAAGTGWRYGYLTLTVKDNVTQATSTDTVAVVFQMGSGAEP